MQWIEYIPWWLLFEPSVGVAVTIVKVADEVEDKQLAEFIAGCRIPAYGKESLVF